MTATAATPSPADEVVQIVSDLYALIDERMKAHPVLAGMFFYIFLRVTRLRDHLVRFVARVRAGAKPRVRKELVGEAAIVAAQKSRRRRRDPTQWPTKPRALAEMLGRVDGAAFADRLHALLAKPDAVAYILANPGIGRYLRPLCRAFGVPVIPELRLKRKRRSRNSAGRTAKTSSVTPALPATHVPPVVPPPEIPVAELRTFTPSEDDPPMAERIARHLARRRFIWREV